MKSIGVKTVAAGMFLVMVLGLAAGCCGTCGRGKVAKADKPVICACGEVKGSAKCCK